MERIFYFVGGPSGVGKTTLIKKINKKRNLIISTGKIYKFIINKKFKIKEKNLNLLKWKNYEDSFFSLLCSKIKDETKKNVVLDTHFAVNSPTGFLSGFSEKNLLKLTSILKQNGFKKIYIIHILAPMEKIYQRIKLDKNRKRYFTREKIKELLFFSEKYFNLFEKNLSKNIKVEKIKISNNSLPKSISLFINVIEK